MKVNRSIFRNLISINFIAIVALLASAFYALLWPFDCPFEFWIQKISEHIMLGGLYFANVKWFFPYLYSKEKPLTYIIVLILGVLVLVKVNSEIGKMINVDEAYVKAWSKPGCPYVPEHDWDNQSAIFLTVIFLGLSHIAALVQRHQSERLAFQISEKERISTELSFLKAQINPHFFFNTLNMIYSLTDTDQPAAKESIYTLSHMMRYIIYDTKSDVTLLSREIKFLEDYILLMKGRIPNSAKISFAHSSIQGNKSIAPMLLLPFVENAFKHGIMATESSFINIKISTTQNEIRFEVRNSYFSKPSSNLEESSGIGIINTCRRLDLLYPNNYSLSVEKDEDSKEYRVQLLLKSDAD